MRTFMRTLALVGVLLICTTEVRAERPDLVVQTGHFGPVGAVAFSPDAKLLASAGFDNTITLWDTHTGDQLRSLKAHTNKVSSVAFGANGSLLASGSYDGTARIWDPVTGQLRRTIQAHALAIDSAAVSPDGRLLATGSFDNSIKLWNIATGQELRALSGHSGSVAAVAFSPNGKTLVSGSHDHTVKLWDVASGDPIRVFTGHRVAVLGVAFSTDGRQVASGGGGYSGHAVVIVWDVASGKSRHEFQTTDEWVSSVAFSPDGELLIAGTSTRGRALRLWNLTTGKEVGTLPTKADAVYALAFSPNGQLFASGGSDNAISLRDPKTWKELRTLQGHVYAITTVALSADNRLLASAGRARDIKLWDLARPTHLRKLSGHANEVAALAFSPQGNLLASASHDKNIKLWDSATGKELRTLSGHVAPVRCIAFSPDGTLLATGADDTSIKLWKVATGTVIRTLTGHIDFVRAVAFSPRNGELLASASGDTTIKLWNTGTGQEIRTIEGHDNWVQAVTFSPDGEVLASGSVDRTVKLWSVSTGRELRTLHGHTAAVENVVFLAGGTKLASGGWDRTVKVWDIASGRELSTLAGHSDAVTALAASKVEGQTGGSMVTQAVWSGSLDTQIVLWDTAGGRSLANLTALDDNDWAVVGPDGRFDASPEGMMLMHWVAGNEPIALNQLKERFWEPGLLAKLLGFSPEPLRNVSAFTDVKLFPSVEIVPVGGDSTEFAIKLTNRGGGIGRVEVYVNDKLMVKDARVEKFDPDAAETTITVNLPGAPFVHGRPNTVRVVAFNADGYLSSRGVTLGYTTSGAASQAPVELYAIVAGISDYASEKMKLGFPTQDAVNFAKALQIGAKPPLFERVHLTLLISGGDPSSAPTKANFRKAFERAKRARPTDVLVVYLAGHGISLQRGSDLYAYLTQDARDTDAVILSDPALLEQWTVTSEELSEWMTGQSGVPALKQVLILDTCAAGAAAAKLTERRAALSGAAIRALDRLKDRTGFHILMGSASDKNSYGASRYGAGVLTHALLLGMRGAALRDDQFVDVSKLFQFARDEVPRLASDIGGIQRPQIAARRGDSFDIGELSPEDKAAIPLARPKHLVLRPQLLNPEEVDDTLNLAVALGKRLQEQSYAKELGSLKGSPMVYVPADEMPGAIRVTGTYRVVAGTVHVKLVLRLDRHLVQKLQIEGPATDIDTLLDRMIEAITQVIGNLPEPKFVGM